jgi:hypothetical protein
MKGIREISWDEWIGNNTEIIKRRLDRKAL